MIPLINSEMVNNGWMNLNEVADIVAIAEMTPGPVGLNCATFAGMRVAGLVGAIAANLGILAPTLTLTAIAAVFFERFKKSRTMENMMFAVRPACIGMIAAIIIDLCLTNYIPGGAPAMIPALIGAAALVLLMKFRLSVPLVIISGAIMGILFC